MKTQSVMTQTTATQLQGCHNIFVNIIKVTKNHVFKVTKLHHIILSLSIIMFMSLFPPPLFRRARNLDFARMLLNVFTCFHNMPQCNKDNCMFCPLKEMRNNTWLCCNIKEMLNRHVKGFQILANYISYRSKDITYEEKKQKRVLFIQTKALFLY